MVSVTVEEFRSQPVSVIGAVNTPGIHQLRGRKTLIEMLSLAGGLRQDSGNIVKITRKSQYGPLGLPNSRISADGQYSVSSVDVKTLMEARDPQVNIQIEPEDVISVPRAEMVYVVGEISRAGGFVLNERESISVLKALALAGGLNRTASPQNAKILRSGGDGAKSGEIPVDLSKVLDGRAKDVEMKSDDILFIPGSATKRASLRALEAAIQVGTGVAIWRR